MNEHDVDTAIRRVLHRIAPEADLDSVGPNDDLQETLDLDSMDFLNFVIGLKEETGVEVPESDYPRVSTLAAGTAYLSAWSGRA